MIEWEGLYYAPILSGIVAHVSVTPLLRVVALASFIGVAADSTSLAVPTPTTCKSPVADSRPCAAV